MSIGMSQVKSAFGFVTSAKGCTGYTGITTGPPQQGQDHYEYNYQIMEWYTQNWEARITVDPTVAKNAATALLKVTANPKYAYTTAEKTAVTNYNTCVKFLAGETNPLARSPLATQVRPGP